MKIILRSGGVIVAVGMGLSLAVLPAGSASAAGGTQVPCNDITGLIDAINEANTSGGRIVLAPHCTYTLTAPDNTDNGLPEITGDVTISGRDTTIRRDPDSTESFRILRVLPSGTLTLKSLTVSGGSLDSDTGGGIAVREGTLNLNHTVIKGNRADTGGGLSNFAGQLNLDRSNVVRNTAARFGGGILNDGNGTLTMKRGSLLKNEAAGDNGGGLENILGTASLEYASVKGNTSALLGGGIRNTNGSTLLLTSTTVRENTAESGGGLSNNIGPATLVRSLVTRNTASSTGGGILNEGGGEVTLTDTRVIRNTPDNCAPEGSVPGCTNPTKRNTPSTVRQSPPSDDIKVRE
ncbi:right-handed parallel beta-helix repeat-containing protein [Streptomyces coffeae]|uniref:Right-handed parallel beta-helix repeat-containing protein n=1 Tax=Streptomyces coffeae TaxID=621382 RepID=A0ABS1N7P2_9ACTN|nr:right-handed parallel beta-helix repeat-containing protein [Streptomyces coffeae]MBL1096094.1 right-handed parallel beta-helix repeat-containing protein [Streptomyces coffeae]